MLKRKEGEESDENTSHKREHRRTHSHHYQKQPSRTTRNESGGKDEKGVKRSGRTKGPSVPIGPTGSPKQASRRLTESATLGEIELQKEDYAALSEPEPLSSPRIKTASLSGTPGSGTFFEDTNSLDTVLRIDPSIYSYNSINADTVKEAPITDIDINTILGCSKSDKSTGSNASNATNSSVNDSDIEHDIEIDVNKEFLKKEKERKNRLKHRHTHSDNTDVVERIKQLKDKKKIKKSARTLMTSTTKRSKSKQIGDTTQETTCKLPHPRTIHGKWTANSYLSGRVFSGTSEQSIPGTDNKLLAIKKHSNWEIGATLLSQVSLRFASLTRIPRHPCVSASYDLCRRGDHTIYSVSSLAPGVSLNNAILTRGAFSEVAAVACIAQVMAGLQHLHTTGFIHGNLHGGNVIIDTTTGECCIVDIPLYALVEDPYEDLAIRGAPEYLAPEVVARAPGRVPQSDVWAVGCICAELLSGVIARGKRHPVAVLADALAGIPQQKIPQDASPECKEFLDICFARNIEMRQSFAALRKLPFFTGFIPEGASPKECAEVLAKELPKLLGNTQKQGSEGKSYTSVSVCICGETEEDAARCGGNESITELTTAVDTLSLGEFKRRGFRNISNAFVRCRNAQEDLHRTTSDLHRYTIAAQERTKACRVRMNKTLADYAKVRADRDRIVKKLEVMRENLSFFESEIIMNAVNGDKSKIDSKGITSLAMLVYGKLSVRNVKMARTGNIISKTLEVRCNEGPKWKQRFVIIRDNFVFIYKSDSESEIPKKVIRLRNMPCAKRTSDVAGKSFCFELNGTDFVFSTTFPGDADECVSKINAGVRWSEVPRLTLSSSQTPPINDTKKPKFRVFGAPAAELSARDPASESDPWLPALLDMFVREIINRGLNIEGILRISGSTSEMNELQERFESTYRAAEVDISKVNIHNVAGLMKIWIRKLPPLVDRRGNEAINNYILANRVMTSKEEAREFLKVLEPYCSLASFAVFMRLTDLVVSISRNEKVNKMDLKNIFTCLGPSFGSDLDYKLLLYFSKNSDAMIDFFSAYKMILIPHKKE